jgi:hypothetical protein
MDVQQEAFKEFSPAELDVGYYYAIEHCQCRVDYAALKLIGNQAGAIRKATNRGANEAAKMALDAYIKRNRISSMQVARRRAYIRSVAKMLSERSPKRVAKRARDERAAELKSVG